MPQRPRILIVYSQPEHYFNRMIDALCRQSDLEYVVAFTRRGPALNRENPVPDVARSIFLRRCTEGPTGRLGAFRKEHVDWRGELGPLNYQAVIVNGYATRTQREVLQDARHRGLPTAMLADSNLRSQRGRSCAKRMFRAMKRRFLKPVIARTDVLLPTNRLGVAYWRYYGAPRQKIVRCSYYADYERCEAAANTDRQEVLSRHGFDVNSRLMVTAARLIPAKGLDTMIQAFRASKLGEQGWVYALAGTGPLDASLKALAGPELGRSIRFLGFMQQSDLLPLMRHANWFVLPSVYEPHGIVIHEALSMGTPVIASDVCGAAYDLVRTGDNGWLFRTGDVESLRSVLLRAGTDIQPEAEVRGRARATFEAWHARTNPVTVIDATMHRLLGRAGVTRGL